MMSIADRKKVAERNFIRAEAGLPLLGDREYERLLKARAQRVFEAVFQVERTRFDRWISEGEGFLSKLGRWSNARQTVMSELQTGKHPEAVLESLGYKLVEDCWSTEGRKTYVHDENADREFLADLKRTLGQYGWKKHKTILRCFLNDSTAEMLEVEPGGADTSGHFIHYLKSE
jgi:hypothetical protein